MQCMTISKMDTLKDWTGKSNKFSYAFQKKYPALVLKRLDLFLHCFKNLFRPRAELCGNSESHSVAWGSFLHDLSGVSLLSLLNRTLWLWYCASLSSSSPCPAKSAVGIGISFPCSCFACCLTVFCIIWKKMSPPMVLPGYHPSKTKVKLLWFCS